MQRKKDNNIANPFKNMVKELPDWVKQVNSNAYAKPKMNSLEKKLLDTQNVLNKPRTNTIDKMRPQDRYPIGIGIEMSKKKAESKVKQAQKKHPAVVSVSPNTYLPKISQPTKPQNEPVIVRQFNKLNHDEFSKQNMYNNLELLRANSEEAKKARTIEFENDLSRIKKIFDDIQKEGEKSQEAFRDFKIKEIDIVGKNVNTFLDKTTKNLTKNLEQAGNDIMEKAYSCVNTGKTIGKQGQKIAKNVVDGILSAQDEIYKIKAKEERPEMRKTLHNFQVAQGKAQPWTLEEFEDNFYVDENESPEQKTERKRRNKESNKQAYATLKAISPYLDVFDGVQNSANAAIIESSSIWKRYTPKEKKDLLIRLNAFNNAGQHIDYINEIGESDLSIGNQFVGELAQISQDLVVDYGLNALGPIGTGVSVASDIGNNYKDFIMEEDAYAIENMLSKMAMQKILGVAAKKYVPKALRTKYGPKHYLSYYDNWDELGEVLAKTSDLTLFK